MASLVELPPVPASTLILPAANSTARLDHLDVLLVIERGRFARRADRHDAVHARLDLGLDQSFQRGFIHLSALEKA